jgi:predicted ribosome quality control (RQC) complex YloA/Tae2 family protein
MSEFDEFSKFVDEIMAQGYTEDQASEFASLIGDTPEIDEHGNVIVTDEQGQIIATLKPLKFLAG